MNDLEIVSEGLRDTKSPNALPKLLNVGITGTIGSGKSTFAQLLQEHGAAVIDMDVISRQITSSHGLAIDSIRVEFGDEAIDATGALNREWMRNKVFKDASAKQALENLTHPIIREEAVRQAHALSLSSPLCLVYDIPLLLNNHMWLDQLDAIIVVVCEKDVQIKRVLQRNPNYTKDIVESILEQQASRTQLLEIASVVLDNSQNGTIHLQPYTLINILVRYIEQLAQLKSTQQGQP